MLNWVRACVCSSHVITSDISIEQMAKDAEFFLSDGLIVTGDSTAMSADVDQLKGKSCLLLVLVIGWRELWHHMGDIYIDAATPYNTD